jgi:hypothetical protein
MSIRHVVVHHIILPTLPRFIEKIRHDFGSTGKIKEKGLTKAQNGRFEGLCSGEGHTHPTLTSPYWSGKRPVGTRRHSARSIISSLGVEVEVAAKVEL